MVPERSQERRILGQPEGRLLWLAIGGLAVGQVVTAGIALSRSSGAPQPAALVPPLSQAAHPAPSQGFLGSGGRPSFEISQILLVAAGKDQVLNSILADAGLDQPARASVLPLVVDYMERVNRVEPEAGSSPSYFAYVELRNDLSGQLQTQVGAEPIAALMAALEEAGIVPHYRAVVTGDESLAGPDLTFGSAPVTFSQASIDALSQGQVAWLEGFIESEGLDAEGALQLRQALVGYMGQIDEIDIMAYRRVHDASQSASFRELENTRLLRALHLSIGQAGIERLGPLLEENHVLVH